MFSLFSFMGGFKDMRRCFYPGTIAIGDAVPEISDAECDAMAGFGAS